MADVLIFTVTGKLFFLNLPGTQGTPALGDPLDFAHSAHPILTPLYTDLYKDPTYLS